MLFADYPSEDCIEQCAEDEDEPCCCPVAGCKADEEISYHDNEPQNGRESASQHLFQRLAFVVLQHHVEYLLADGAPEEDEPGEVPHTVGEAYIEEQNNDREPHYCGDLAEDALQLLKACFSVSFVGFLFGFRQGIERLFDLVNILQHVPVSIKLTHANLDALVIFRFKLVCDGLTGFCGGGRAYLLAYCLDLF